jgi:DNA-binding NarL/FixJ family response regulator
MSKTGIRDSFYQRVPSEANPLRWNAYTLIITCLMLIETVVVALFVSSDIVVALVAAIGLVVIWGFIKLQDNKLDKELIDDETNNYIKLLSFQTVGKELSYNNSSLTTTLDMVLSDRELEVLKHIANGSSNKQTAMELNISQQTVKNHLKHIFSKMKVTDRTSAVLLAMRNGWLKN